MTTATIEKSDTEKLAAANAVLDCFAPGTTLERVGARVYVSWTNSRGHQRCLWRTRGNDFYPVCHHRWAHGGTASTALSQLVRWILGRPVLPYGTWRYWTGENVSLGRDRGREILTLLQFAEYPHDVPCVLCGKSLLGRSLDWWHLDGVNGPCCSFHDQSGCQHNPPRP